MQEKTIKSVLNRKLKDWVSSIKDNPSLQNLIRRDAICTGGAIASMLQGQEPNDFDFYFKTKSTCEAVARYYVEKFKQNPPSRFKGDANRTVSIEVQSLEDRIKIVVKSQGIAGEDGTDSYQYFEQVGDPSEPIEFVDNILSDKEDADKKTNDEGAKKDKYRPVFLTSNAITLSEKIQVVVRFSGDISTIHESYDFVHCTCSWDAETNTLNLPNAALVSMLNKRLKYKQSKYPLCSIIRTRKFLKLGWHIDAGQYVKMAWDLNKLNLADINILEDQMIGVDSAYFQEVIGLLKERTEEGKKIDETYLIEIIDRIFG
jgi:hypothetical protein